MSTSRWLPLRAWGSLLKRMGTAQVLVFGYAPYMLLGWIVLCLPGAQQGAPVSGLDHLFTAVSAVSTTGLVTVSTADSYSLWGELTIALLIQFGGLGYMTLSSLVVMALAGELSPNRQRIVRASISLPEDFNLAHFLVVLGVFTVAIELAGALALYAVFAGRGVEAPFWHSLFHSISAFCTAGFGLFNNSFEDYRDDLWLNLVISFLCFLGAIGYIVVYDVWR